MRIFVPVVGNSTKLKIARINLPSVVSDRPISDSRSGRIMLTPKPSAIPADRAMKKRTPKRQPIWLAKSLKLVMIILKEPVYRDGPPTSLIAG